MSELDFGPTVAGAQSATFDYGNAFGIAVEFKGSGYRHAVRAPTQAIAIKMMRETIAEAPHGRNRHGQAWVPR